LRFTPPAAGAPAPSPAISNPNRSVGTGAERERDTALDAEPNFTRHVLPWVLMGTGAASLLVGGVTFSWALQEAEQLDESPNCVDRVCLAAEENLVRSFNTLNVASGITLIGGGVLAAAGATLWFVQRDSRAAAPSASLYATPSGLWFEGEF
jgi:hypothetical protein